MHHVCICELFSRATVSFSFSVCLHLQVYLPCILEAKKRYVGYSFESPDQKEPTFDDKGIETVRRDSCPAVGKVRDLVISAKVEGGW